MSQDPCYWIPATSTMPIHIPRKRGHVGPAVERTPSRGVLGVHDAQRPAPGIRSVRVVRHDGHVVDSCLTNGAAHLEPSLNNLGMYGQYMRAKWRALGWFPLGTCPLTQLAAGNLFAESFFDQSLLEQKPCTAKHDARNPCPHAQAELAARRAVQVEETRQIDARFVDKTEQLIDVQREGNHALVDAITKIAALAQTQPAEPAATEVPKKRRE